MKEPTLRFAAQPRNHDRKGETNRDPLKSGKIFTDGSFFYRPFTARLLLDENRGLVDSIERKKIQSLPKKEQTNALRKYAEALFDRAKSFGLVIDTRVVYTDARIADHPQSAAFPNQLRTTKEALIFITPRYQEISYSSFTGRECIDYLQRGARLYEQLYNYLSDSIVSGQPFLFDIFGIRQYALKRNAAGDAAFSFELQDSDPYSSSSGDLARIDAALSDAEDGIHSFLEFAESIATDTLTRKEIHEKENLEKEFHAILSKFLSLGQGRNLQD